MHAELLYASIGCNRNVQALDCSSDGYMCYAGNSSICLFRSNDPQRLLVAMPAHSGAITSLQFVQDKGNRIGIVSGSVDKSVKFWTFSRGHDLELEHSSAVSLESSVCTLAGLTELINDQFLFVAAGSCNQFAVISTDGRLEQARVLATVGVNSLITSVGITVWNGHVLMAIATTDCKIGIYHWQSGRFVTWLTGHENWITSLSFLCDNKVLWLASASQDKFIRVWAVTGGQEESANTFTIDDCLYSISLNTLLMGHDDWVYSVRWYRHCNSLGLISCSADRTVILWEPGQSNAIWKPTAHLGILAGGSSQGIFGAVALEDGQIFANEYSGSIFYWKLNKQSQEWTPFPSLTGHMGPVTDVCWNEIDNDPTGGFSHAEWLLSTSVDQTSRIHCECTKYASGLWHEIARPQIHGYDIRCAASLGGTRIATGSDEKCLRVFEATKGFVRSLGDLTAIGEHELEALLQSATVACANVPALGLSNKATEHESNDSNASKTAVFPTLLPTEPDLANLTRWPEVDKLYGHVFELFAMSFTARRGLIATSSKSFKAEFGNILLWDARKLNLFQTLPAVHSLTVTKTAFSPDTGNRLLSVSRDRSLAIFECAKDEQFQFIERVPEAHSRIIWDCCWLNEHSFATVSRDKLFKLWTYTDGKVTLCAQQELPAGGNAIDCTSMDNANWLLAIGLENGAIEIYKVTLELSVKRCHSLAKVHGDCVNRVKWGCNFKLASCSSDHSLKLHRLSF